MEMFKHATTTKKYATRSQDNHLVGSALEKFGSLPPTFREVMRHVIHERNKIYFTKSRLEKSDHHQVYKAVATAIVNIWTEKCNIPCVTVHTLTERMKSELDVSGKFLEISKHQSRYQSDPTKKKTLDAELDRLYDVAKCNCYQNAKSMAEAKKIVCYCKSSAKIPEDELKFYFRINFDRDSALIGGVDKEGTEKYQDLLRKLQEIGRLADQKKARELKHQQSQAAESSVTEVLDSESDEEIEEGNKISFESITDLDYTIEACLRYARSENGISFILNSVLLDVKMALDKGKSLDSIWKGRTTIQNKIIKLFTHKINTHVENFRKDPIEIIGFDECTDFTIQIGNKIEKEKHLTITSGSKYVDHATLEDKTGRSIAKAVHSTLLETDSMASVKVAQADGTSSNVSHESGAIHLLELELKRSLFYDICCLHGAERPRKKIFQLYGGETSSANTYKKGIFIKKFYYSLQNLSATTTLNNL